MSRFLLPFFFLITLGSFSLVACPDMVHNIRACQNNFKNHGEFTIRVVDHKKQPIQNINVQISGNPQVFRTNAQGEISFVTSMIFSGNRTHVHVELSAACYQSKRILVLKSQISKPKIVMMARAHHSNKNSKGAYSPVCE